MTNTTNSAEDGQAPNQQPPAQAANSEGQAPNESPTTNISLTIAEDLQRQIAELRKENAAHRKKAKEQELAAQQAEEARLREQGEYKTLAEKHAARVNELEPIAQGYNQLVTLVSGQIEAQIKEWPAEVKALDPGPDASIETRLTWIEKSRPLVAKLQSQTQTRPAAGNAPNPRPAAGNAQQNNVAELRQRYQSARGNPF